jgi:hypothetical protein
MGEPVTTGMMIGAALGGGGAALKGGNPIKGALLGGAMGAAGGSFAGGFGGAGGGAAGSANAMIPGVQGGMGTLAGETTALTAPTFMQQLSGGFSALGSDIGAANKYLNQNPFTAQAGMSLAGSAFAPEQPMSMAPAGQVQRGQIQPIDYMSLLNPQQQTVMRPQPISLL